MTSFLIVWCAIVWFFVGYDVGCSRTRKKYLKMLNDTIESIECFKTPTVH